MNKLLQNPAALCNMVRRVAVEAGAITLRYFEDESAHGTQMKGDGSPVTKADHEAEEYIAQKLDEILPGVPFVGEELTEHGKAPDVSAAEYFWLCDPLDGTKEFMKGSPDYTVNIGLICQGVPVLGVIYAPARGTIYAAYEGGKAVRWSEDTDKEKEIWVRRPPREGLTAVTNYRGRSEKFETFLQNYKINKVLYLPSSLKLCAIAEGKVDIYPRMAPISEWDTAAGDAILRAAGGGITDLDGLPLRYGKKAFQNPPFVASAFDWRSEGDS